MISFNMALALMGAAVAVDWRCGTGLTGLLCHATWSTSVRTVKWVRRQFRRAPVTFGSARWLREREAAELGLLGSTGLIVGKLGRRLLRFADVEGSVVVFAPQGAGKGVGIVVPNLLSYAGSVI